MRIGMIGKLFSFSSPPIQNRRCPLCVFEGLESAGLENEKGVVGRGFYTHAAPDGASE